ncbi:Protein kinase-like domain [Pseudocohnilembus persalinus]|uniref:Casein kinase I n=1 Tax=Pseudocohnilembus persalinus TaxID=266149 RepID=A0A0V0QI66_PSEPJ|nr:Protein kinase-like domain [Pseudocohnilembus persalinus]|eukprot:KRX01985.1 Protein kinase-like domain [Pseudocohnilembus persalinus]
MSHQKEVDEFDPVLENFDELLQQEKQNHVNIGKSFRLIKKIDQGSYSEIFLGKNLETNMEVAVKVEKITAKQPKLLFYESRVYQYLLKEKQKGIVEQLYSKKKPKVEKGFPEIFACSNEGDYNILIMENLGPDLEVLFQICNKKFDLKTVCIIAIQVLQRLQFMSQKYLIHRDVKPSNFCIGKKEKKNVIYMIDLAFAKKYMTKDRQHIAFQENQSMTGTLLYSSINSHKGYELSRRDDLQSLAYMLFYFLKGSLPWQNLKCNRKEKLEKTIEKKLQNPEQSLFKGIQHLEFINFYQYAQNLEFEQEPDYQYWMDQFEKLVYKNGQKIDYIYSWNLAAQSEESQIKVPEQKISQTQL